MLRLMLTTKAGQPIIKITGGLKRGNTSGIFIQSCDAVGEGSKDWTVELEDKAHHDAERRVQAKIDITSQVCEALHLMHNIPMQNGLDQLTFEEIASHESVYIPPKAGKGRRKRKSMNYSINR